MLSWQELSHLSPAEKAKATIPWLAGERASVRIVSEGLMRQSGIDCSLYIVICLFYYSARMHVLTKVSHREWIILLFFLL